MSVRSPGRALPAVVALIALLALAGEAAAQASSSTDAALSAERYYSSYGRPQPLVRAQADTTHHGIGTAPFVLALSGALVVGLALGSLPAIARGRVGEVS